MKRPAIPFFSSSFSLFLSLALGCGPIDEQDSTVSSNAQALKVSRHDVVAVTAAGTVGNKPGQYCNLQQGKLVIRVKNNGSVLIGSTVAGVEGPFGSVAFTVPWLSPREIYDYTLDTLQVGSPFKIVVDATNVIPENDENNTFGGTCP